MLSRGFYGDTDESPYRTLVNQIFHTKLRLTQIRPFKLLVETWTTASDYLLRNSHTTVVTIVAPKLRA